MNTRVSTFRIVPVLTAIAAPTIFAAPSPSIAGDRPPLGCYERIYDASHMRAHKGQIVRRVALEIEALRPEQLRGNVGDIVNNADLRMWVPGHRKTFASFGVCRARDGGWDCSGHDLASEHRTCAKSTPGVHSCRAPGRTDKFRLELRPEGMLVTIPVALQLDISDSGPYLNLLSFDRANSTFLLGPAPTCR